jgi:hypothetical protein
MRHGLRRRKTIVYAADCFQMCADKLRSQAADGVDRRAILRYASSPITQPGYPAAYRSTGATWLHAMTSTNSQLQIRSIL